MSRNSEVSGFCRIFARFMFRSLLFEMSIKIFAWPLAAHPTGHRRAVMPSSENRLANEIWTVFHSFSIHALSNQILKKKQDKVPNHGYNKFPDEKRDLVMKTWLWPIPVIWQPFWKLEHTMTRYDIKVVAGVSIFSCKPVWPISYILYQPMSAKRSHSHSFSFSSQGRPVHVVFRSARSGIHEYAHLQHISNLGKWCSHANAKM